MLRRMTLLPALLLLSGALVSTGSACSNSPGSGTFPPGQICTEIGCGPNLKVILPDISEAQGEITVRHCLDGNCEEMSFSSLSEVPMEFDLMANDKKVSLSVEVRDSSQLLAQLPEAELTLKELRPNGPKCEPVCYSGEARVPASDD